VWAKFDSRFGEVVGPVARESKSVRTRRRILDAAAEVFSEQGYAARLSDIADRAGMKAGSLYYHFDSREDLVAEVLRLGIEGSWDQVAAAVGRLPSAAGPLERLSAAIRAHTLSIVGRSAYTTAQARIVGSLPPDLARAHRKDRRAYGEYWRDLFGAAQRAGQLNGEIDLFVAQMLAFGAMNWTSEWYRSDLLTAEQLADQVVLMFLHGVVAAPQSPKSR
jgi:TetR/AcrR family transcriptional regulator, cholesterol catabolism regulator